jgi:hypothetical protein
VLFQREAGLRDGERDERQHPSGDERQPALRAVVQDEPAPDEEPVSHERTCHVGEDIPTLEKLLLPNDHRHRVEGTHGACAQTQSMAVNRDWFGKVMSAARSNTEPK